MSDIQKQLYKDWIISIFHDKDAENPMEWHDEIFLWKWEKWSKYPSDIPQLEHLENLAEDLGIDTEDKWEAIERVISNAEFFGKSGKVEKILPVYKFEHGGVAYSTKPFSCRWDSGQVGFVFSKNPEITTEQLANVVELYSKWASGDVFGFKITDRIHNDVQETLCGYYSIEEAIEEAKNYIDKNESQMLLNQINNVQAEINNLMTTLHNLTLNFCHRVKNP